MLFVKINRRIQLQVSMSLRLCDASHTRLCLNLSVCQRRYSNIRISLCLYSPDLCSS